MYLFQAAKLAWANTSDDWQRLMVRCSGIMFAVILIFMQTGFRNALFDSNVRIAERIDADFIIRTRTRYMLSSGQLMPYDKITMAKNVPGVREVQPIYIETVASYLRKPGHPARRLRVIALDTKCTMYGPLDLERHSELLNAHSVAIVDKKSKPFFDVDEEACRTGQAPLRELARKRVQFVGCFELGIDFSNDGNMIMTPVNFAHYFPHRGRGRPLQWVDYGVIKCEEGADKDDVLAELKHQLGPHVIVNTKNGFLASERNFWGTRTPIGLIFMVGTIIGFVVGLIICYQVLATDIGDHLSEFATIKAMGYPTSFFAAVVVIQAMFLSLISFVPGLIVTLATFTLVNNVSGLVMFLNFERVAVVLLLTVGMCVISGVIALRKLLLTDPANLF